LPSLGERILLRLRQGFLPGACVLFHYHTVLSAIVGNRPDP